MEAFTTTPADRSVSTAWRLLKCLPLLGLLAIVGCGESPRAPTEGQASSVSDGPGMARRTTGSDRSSYLAAKLKVKTNSGATEMSLKPKDDGAKLVDASEQELARYNIQGDKLKIKDPRDNVLGYVVGAAPRFKVKDATQEQDLFKLIGQDDGDWKLEDAHDTLLYKIKRRPYGFEIEDPSKKSLYKIKVNGPKTSIRDATEETVRYTNDPVHPLAFACLALDAIADLRVRAALMVAVQQGL